jgi:hypothetical protein
MAPKEKQKIEIEKSHGDPLLSFNQAVMVNPLGLSWDSTAGKSIITMQDNSCMSWFSSLKWIDKARSFCQKESETTVTKAKTRNR